MVLGWIMLVIFVVLLFFGNFEFGLDVIKVMIVLQLIVMFIFFILGIMCFGFKFVDIIFDFMKVGILMGVGIVVFIGEIVEGG